MSKPRIVIADDHPILAEGLRRLLEPEFEVVAIVADGRELVAAVKQHRPDIVIADVNMPKLNGIDAALRLREGGSKSKVIFLTMHRDVGYARRAMETGAAGFVLKQSAATELVTAVREALRGRTFITPIIAGELFQSVGGGGKQSREPIDCLTSRQREVLQLVAEGRSAKEIAAVLGISVRTAEAHKARILDVLGLGTTAELVQFAIRNGIISI